VAHSEPTKAFSKQSPETAMLSAPFRCTHPPPPIPPFLLKQNLSREVIAGSDVTRGKDMSGYIRERVNSAFLISFFSFSVYQNENLTHETYVMMGVFSITE